jgi:Amidase
MDKAIIELLARRAGLDKALAEFPGDVAAAELASGSVAKHEGADRSARRTVAANAHRKRVMTDLHWMTATEAARAIAARKLSPVELMQALLERIGRLDPKLNVFIRLDGDAALDAARAAEAEIVSGHQRGPLHGVPVGIKDIIDVAGLPTTCHSKVFDRQRRVR